MRERESEGGKERVRGSEGDRLRDGKGREEGGEEEKIGLEIYLWSSCTEDLLQTYSAHSSSKHLLNKNS